MIKNNKKFELLLVLLLSVTFNAFAETLPLAVSPDIVAEQPIVDKVADAPPFIETKAPVTLKAPEPAVFVHKVKGKMNTIYKNLFTGLENNGYYVIFEPNIGRNLAHSAKRWGKDYNINKLDSIRSMVFCNGWYANKISNEDPTMLALCPLHVTLIHKEDITSVLFVKPGHVSQGSTANSIALELEQDVIRIIKASAR